MVMYGQKRGILLNGYVHTYVYIEQRAWSKAGNQFVYTLFSRFHIPFFALISYLTNSFSIPQIDKWKKTYKRAHYPKKEYATYQPNTLCFAPALLLIPDNQDRR